MISGEVDAVQHKKPKPTRLLILETGSKVSLEATQFSNISQSLVTLLHTPSKPWSTW